MASTSGSGRVTMAGKARARGAGGDGGDDDASATRTKRRTKTERRTEAGDCSPDGSRSTPGLRGGRGGAGLFAGEDNVTQAGGRRAQAPPL